MKLLLANLFRLPFLFDICFAYARFKHGTNYLRAVNYHSTAPTDAKQFEKHLQFYTRYYRNVTLQDLEDFFAGKWHSSKPGLIVSFDDGLRSNYEVAMPLLEKYGFTGWFMVPVELIGCTAVKESHHIGEDYHYADGRMMMNWQEVRSMLTNHVIACHTSQHVRMREDVSFSVVKSEIQASKALLEKMIEQTVRCFCWVGGEVTSYSATAAALVRDSGYEFSFMTCSGPILPSTNKLQIHRTNIEAFDKIPLVRFQLSGAMDVFHRGRRTRVNQITSLEPVAMEK